MRRWGSRLVLFFVLCAASGAKAQTAPPASVNSWDGQPAPAQPGASAPGGWGYAPAYGGGYYGGQGPPPQAFLMYDSQKKSPGLALVIEVFLPGVGSLYADHATGALMTWGLIVGGFALVVFGINSWDLADDRDGNADDVTPILLGLGLIVGGRIHGLWDSYAASRDFNRALAQRLGLGGMQMTLAPIKMGGVTAWGPALGFRF